QPIKFTKTTLEHERCCAAPASARPPARPVRWPSERSRVRPWLHQRALRCLRRAMISAIREESETEGGLAPWVIEDGPAGDERRPLAGLPTLPENTECIREGTARDGEDRLRDWREREPKFVECARSVGSRR